MYKEVDRNLNLTDVVSRVRFLKYDRLTKVMVYGWKDKIMTDKLMYALSTMTEINSNVVNAKMAAIRARWTHARGGRGPRPTAGYLRFALFEGHFQ